MNGCRWPSCPEPAHARGFCHRHYQTLRTSGRIRTSLADPGPVRRRIATQLERGHTLHSLGDTAGVEHHAMVAIHQGRTRRVRRATAGAILGVPLAPTTIGTVRRVRALARIGYGQADVAEAAGVSFAALRTALLRRRVTPALGQAVADTYERLSGTPGPNKPAIRAATRKHWPSPMAWYGIDVDDPAARQDGKRYEDKRRTRKAA